MQILSKKHFPLPTTQTRRTGYEYHFTFVFVPFGGSKAVRSSQRAPGGSKDRERERDAGDRDRVNGDNVARFWPSVTHQKQCDLLFFSLHMGGCRLGRGPIPVTWKALWRLLGKMPFSKECQWPGCSEHRGHQTVIQQLLNSWGRLGVGGGEERTKTQSLPLNNRPSLRS